MGAINHLTGAVALAPNRETGAALILNGAEIVDGDVFTLLVFEILLDRREEVRLLADSEHAGAVGIHFGDDKLLGSVGERDDRNDRCNADNDAEKRQDGAQLVGPEGLQSQSQSFNELHGISP